MESVNGQTGVVALTKSDIGLGSVTNDAQLKAANLDTDSAFAANSDTKIASQKAVKTALGGKEATQTAASQAEAEAGTEAAIRKWSPLRISQAIAALAGGGAISNPQMVFVEADGNDGTAEIGNPAKPYLTLQAAYDAGEAMAQAFVIVAGIGQFSMSLPPTGFSGYCKALRGAGYTDQLTTSPTLFTINGQPETVLDGNGTSAPTSLNACEIWNCAVLIYAMGGDVSAQNGDPYVAGNGADVSLYGMGLVTVVARGGGDSASSSGMVTAGDAGSITLQGALRLASDGELRCVSGAPFGGGSNGADKPLTAEGCDLRGSVYAGSIVAGRCSFNSGTTLATDKGGNAMW